MNGAQIHLALNHIPLFGTLFGLLILAVASFRHNDLLRTTGFVVLLASALLTIPAYLTGEKAEDVIENLPGVTHDLIEEHEDAALFAFIGVELLGTVALAGLFFSRRNAGLARGCAMGCLLLSIAVMVVLGRTAHLGGQISHQEIRGDFQPPVPSESAP